MSVLALGKAILLFPFKRRSSPPREGTRANFPSQRYCSPTYQYYSDDKVEAIILEAGKQKAEEILASNGMEGLSVEIVEDDKKYYLYLIGTIPSDSLDKLNNTNTIPEIEKKTGLKVRLQYKKMWDDTVKCFAHDDKVETILLEEGRKYAKKFLDFKGIKGLSVQSIFKSDKEGYLAVIGSIPIEGGFPHKLSEAVSEIEQKTGFKIDFKFKETKLGYIILFNDERILEGLLTEVKIKYARETLGLKGFKPLKIVINDGELYLVGNLLPGMGSFDELKDLISQIEKKIERKIDFKFKKIEKDTFNFSIISSGNYPNDWSLGCGVPDTLGPINLDYDKSLRDLSFAVESRGNLDLTLTISAITSSIPKKQSTQSE